MSKSCGIQLYLDPTACTSHRYYIQINVGNFAGALISDVGLKPLAVEALERQALQQLPHKLQC